MVSRFSASSAGPPLTTGRFLVLISVRGRVNLRTIVRLEALGQLKTPDWRFFIVFTTSSTYFHDSDLNYATTASFQVLANSLFSGILSFDSVPSEFLTAPRAMNCSTFTGTQYTIYILRTPPPSYGASSTLSLKLLTKIISRSVLISSKSTFGTYEEALIKMAGLAAVLLT
jgi:hypothetical protein